MNILLLILCVLSLAGNFISFYLLSETADAIEDIDKEIEELKKPKYIITKKEDL